METYSPKAAWARALVYVAICWLVAFLAGTTELMFSEPLATESQLSNWRWWALFLAALGWIIVAYSFIWSANTLKFDRPRRWGPQLLFGILWGSGSGVWLATIWLLVDKTGWPTFWVWLVSFGLIATWQALWQDFYFDIYVAPEHDTPTSKIAKVPRTHVPNMLISLTFLVIWENVALFVMLQALALVIASVVMRFPAWYETQPVHAAAVKKGPMGIPQCEGWTGEVDEFVLGRR